MSEKDKVCELCEEQPAAVLCSECCRCYCDRCNKTIHELSKKSGHKREDLPEGVKINARCPLHSDDSFKLFCVDEVKLCCGMCISEKLHEGHNVIKITEITKDNEVFSASEVRARFCDVLKCDDELEKKIEEIANDIRSEGAKTGEQIKQTFAEEHEKLNREEAMIIKELERTCRESEEALLKNLGTLRDTREYSRVLSEADKKIRGESSRLMELNLVSEMERGRKTMEELHRMMMTDLKICWDGEKRKLTYTRTLFNGAPTPNNISFPGVFGRGFNISWDCDLSGMSEEDKEKINYTVEVKKSSEDGNAWKEKYTGKDKKCSVSGLDKDTEYDVRVKCVVGELQGRWSDIVNVKTKNVLLDSLILTNETNKELFKDKLGEWCGTTDFELLYQGTRDGFRGIDFHNKCDNRGKTLVLIKNTSGHIFGGFASIPWTSPQSNGKRQAPGSFIFTLTNMHNIKPTKFPLKNENDANAVGHEKDNGPVFGQSDDFYLNSNFQTSESNSNFPKSYNDTTGKGFSLFSSNGEKGNFKAQEVEVFRINV